MAAALLVVVMFSVSEVFQLSTNTAGRTMAHSEMVEAAAAFEAAVREQLGRLKGDLDRGLLIIDGPRALRDRPDLPNAEAIYPLRHDRLVFIAQSPLEPYESVTDRNVPSSKNPGGGPFASPEAVVYFGPGFPDGRVIAPQPGAGAVDATVSAREWIAAQRIVLLRGAFTSFTGEAPPAEYPLTQLANSPPEGLYACGMDAVQETAEELLDRVVAALGSGGTIAGLWELNICPATVNAAIPGDATDNYAYYGRAGFNLQARIADIRIEWSDGSVVDPTDVDPSPGGYQPANPATQWFGARHDTGGGLGYEDPVAGGGASGDVCPKSIWDGVWGDPTWPPAVDPEVLYDPANNAYRAIWTPANWSSRPKAIRVSFRVYDSLDRISNVEVVNREPWATSPVLAGPVRRYGLAFSFVAAVP